MNVGEVEIELDGNKYTLRPSLGAAKKVNASGGFQNVITKLLSYDMDYYVTVISAGLDKRPLSVMVAGGPNLEEAIYKTGLHALVNPLALYVSNLANGGKPVDNEAPKTGEA